MTTVPTPVNGQDINLAARATRKALEALLAEQGTTFPPLAVMNVLSTRGGRMDRAALVEFITTALELDAVTVRLIVHGLQERGLVQPVDTRVVALTDQGRNEHQRLSALAATVTAELYRDLDPQDLAVTRRVLLTLTERANVRVGALLA